MIVGANRRLEDAKSPAAMVQENSPGRHMHDHTVCTWYLAAVFAMHMSISKFVKLFRLKRSTEQSDSHIQSTKSSIRLDVRLGLLSRNRFRTHRIVIPATKHTRPHIHTRYQAPHSSTIQQHRRWLGCYHCCCSSPQISVAHS